MRDFQVNDRPLLPIEDIGVSGPDQLDIRSLKSNSLTYRPEKRPGLKQKCHLPTIDFQG